MKPTKLFADAVADVEEGAEAVPRVSHPEKQRLADGITNATQISIPAAAALQGKQLVLQPERGCWDGTCRDEFP
ncbi:MAG: hypothetical protein H6Q00_3550 [Holophagaceae bacterium]|nr:hypothetical protein [Holophagaceae bacterium]